MRLNCIVYGERAALKLVFALFFGDEFEDIIIYWIFN